MSDSKSIFNSYKDFTDFFGEENCTCFDNGVYCANREEVYGDGTIGISQTLYNSNNYGQTIPALSYYCGDNCSYTDTYTGTAEQIANDSGHEIREMMQGDNPFPGLVTISYSPDDRSHVFEEATGFLEEQGKTISCMAIEAFSAGGKGAFIEPIDYLSTHPETKATILLADPFNYDINTIDCSLLSERGVKILAAIPEDYNSHGDGSAVKNFTAALTKNGIDAMWVTSKGTEHGSLNRDMINNGFYLYSLGLTDEIGNNSVSSLTSSCDYHFYKYVWDEESQRYVETEADISNIVTGDQSLYLVDYSDIKLKYKKSESISQYERLEHISDIPYDNKCPTTYNNSLIQVNLPATYGAINNIRSQIKSSSNFSSCSMPSFLSTSGILSGIISCMENYMCTVGSLYDNLEQETTATLSFKTTIENQDKYLEKKSTEVLDTKNNSSSFVNTVVSKGTNNNSLSSNINSSSKNKINSKIENMTYKYDDGHELCIEYKGDKVISMKNVYSFSSLEEASKEYEEYLDKYSNQDFVAKIEKNDKIISVIFKDDIYNNKTIDELKSYILGGK